MRATPRLHPAPGRKYLNICFPPSNAVEINVVFLCKVLIEGGLDSARYHAPDASDIYFHYHLPHHPILPMTS